MGLDGIASPTWSGVMKKSVTRTGVVVASTE